LPPDLPSSIESETEQAPRTLGWWPLLGFAIVLGMMLIPIPFKGRAAAAISDLAHAPLFACVTIALLFFWYRWQPLDQFDRDWTKRFVLVGVWVFLVGVAIEFAQMVTGRSAAIHDAIANGLGIMAAIAVSFALLNWRYRGDQGWLSVLAVGVAIVTFGSALVMPVRIGLDILAVQRAFPLIASFESKMELTRWYFDHCHGESTDQNVTHRDHAMRILVERAPHPAATLIETVSDWSDVATLELDVTLAQSYPAEMEMIVKLIDEDHANYDTDTAQKTFRLKPGETTHLVFTREEMVNGPEQRPLDMTRIKLVSLLMNTPKVESYVDIDHVRVTK